ncbi:MAG: hypothetical protein IKH51_01060 [Clostridia bacterium]|nr:hypothetical protein [Clostridia bacterium]
MEFIFSENTKELKPSAIREIFKSLTDPSVISFAAGNPSPQSFPVSYFRRFTDEVLDNNADAALQYGITEGFTPLLFRSVRCTLTTLECGSASSSTM